MSVNSLARLKSNGELDETFGEGGFVFRMFNPKNVFDPQPAVFIDSLSVVSNEMILGGGLHNTPAYMKLEWGSLFQNGFD